MPAQKLILASASPRRAELAGQIGLAVEVVPSAVEERLDGVDDPRALVEGLARAKALDVAGRCPNRAVLGADTAVVCRGVIMGKPKSQLEGYGMLKALSGCRHEVYTGLCLAHGRAVLTACERTVVRFAPLTEEQIRAYLRSGEGEDKAGSYGIQGRAAAFIEGIEGCYFNVVGLPLNRLARLLKQAGLEELLA